MIFRFLSHPKRSLSYSSGRYFFVIALTILANLILPDAAAAQPPIGEVMSTPEFENQVAEEYEYRKRIEIEAPKWARELVYLYKWSAKYGLAYHPLMGVVTSAQPSSEEISQRMNSEFAWMLVAGHGLLATFDFKHAEQSLLGSTSRLVAGLTKSRAFWREVKVQCAEVAALSDALSKPNAREKLSVQSCADRLSKDLKVSQLVGSNVSLFVGGGIIIGLGKKVFTKYFSGWFAKRVVPIIPVAARSRWVLGGLTAAVVILPTGYLFAALEQEREKSKEFLENLPELLRETEDLRLKESIMRRRALELERDVVSLAIWINQRLPHSMARDLDRSNEGQFVDHEEAQRFLVDLKMFGPGYSALATRQQDVQMVRKSLEDELSRIPSSHSYLLGLYEKKRQGVLTVDEKSLLRKAQYLAAIRLVAPLLMAGSASGS